ncbi:MAG: hypothetical protein HQ537_02225 [Parcubacteria group bacterium]|nr:hypothetical protein [Parcubacteria group bacterium]
MIKIINSIKQEKGAALLLSIISILSVSLIIGLGLSSLSFNSLISAQNKIKSIESYYAAEAGIEDSLLRLKNGMQFSSPNSLTVEDGSAVVEASDLIGGSQTITSQGNVDNRIRKLAVTYSITSDEVNFFYGAQVGEGGIVMGNNSKIEGNVFSNGSISGGGEITNIVTVANNGNKIEDITVGEDAYVYSCSNANIEGTLYSVSGGTIENCDYDDIEILDNEIEPKDMPISEEQINEWKDDSILGGTISGDYTITESESLGPIKITGDLSIGISAALNITGIIYVQGNVTINNNAIIQLDSNFGSLSGMIISDGKIKINNNVNVQGSGEQGSFLMMLSTNSSTDLNDPAIDLYNNAEGAIFYASNGVIYLHNNMNIREATAYKLAMDNGAIISYDVGLENINFSSGPGGSWQIENWEEIE